ncbi:MAG: chemotaxis protein CheW [Ruminococcus sp.]|jgi:two-component system chemotaxis sensor kinase CheA|nr:chemotaxis protein CheW [Ruminococcus sp.]
MAKFEAGMESMIEMFIYETSGLIEQLDNILMKTEADSSFEEDDINAIFRIMHTIKGSAAMMGLESLSKFAHGIEDMFYVIREEKPVINDFTALINLLLQASDIMKNEMDVIQDDNAEMSDLTEQIKKIEDYAASVKSGAINNPAPEAAPPAAAPAPAASAPAPVVSTASPTVSAPTVSASTEQASTELTVVKVFFDDDCKMENLRAFQVIENIQADCAKLEYIPADIETNSESAKIIIENGFLIKFQAASDISTKAVIAEIADTPNVKSYEVMTEVPGIASGEPVSIRVFFEEDCKMENLRALLVINNIQYQCTELEYTPSDIETNSDSCKVIIENGFLINFSADDPEAVIKTVETTPNVMSYEILAAESPVPAAAPAPTAAPVTRAAETKTEVTKMETQNTPVSSVSPASGSPALTAVEKDAIGTTKAVEKLNSQLGKSTSVSNKQSLISVNLNKLDTLLDLVGEIVITEAMVTSNPDLKGLKLDNFQKAARQLRKLNSELQDTVMSIRMVPLSGAFNKMTRIVRDMKVKLNKDVDLVFEGEETEVDKSIIDQLNDPLMHMVRNSMDHGIEDNPETRVAAGKPAKGKITLAAYNASGEVIITITDDGEGLDCHKILAKAERQGILTKPASEYTDKEIYHLIMLPGFSTNEVVTEFSGRGVGMDVVRQNIEKIGGSVSVDSKFGYGSVFTIKIPLSLSIVDGMEISVGESIFTIPINSIKESFKVRPNQLVKDTSGREMIMIRGEVHPLIRLYDLYGLQSKYTDLNDGIVIHVEADGRYACLYADELIGEQQVVVKPWAQLLNNFGVKSHGMTGCSILGDGSITIILDIATIIGGTN